MSQRFLLTINNRRVVSDNPILATRKDMVECDANGQLVDPVVAASMATSSSAQSVGLTPDPVSHVSRRPYVTNISSIQVYPIFRRGAAGDV